MDWQSGTREASAGLIIEVDTASVSDGFCVVTGARPDIDGPQRTKSITHKLCLKKSLGGAESIVALFDVIASGFVIIDMLADGTVTAMKIPDGRVTFSKLGGDITTAGKVPLDVSARLPAVDVWPLTNLPAATCLPAGAVMLYAGGRPR